MRFCPSRSLRKTSTRFFHSFTVRGGAPEIQLTNSVPRRSMTQSHTLSRNEGVQMTARLLASMSVAGILAAGSAFAQAPKPAANAAPTAKTYKAPRASDGQPDLQGYWSNTTYTPLQRPNGVNKPFFTKEEAEAIIKRAATEEG